jgi:cysteinyl-tRNA synthetase
MNDDFNTPMLIAELFECIKFINNVNIDTKNLNKKDKEKIKNTFEIFLFEILGLINENISNSEKSSDLIELLIKIRNQARANKNFDLSDQIRDDLLRLGIQLNDEKNESSYKLI